MRLFTSARATNPRRVELFLAEKGIRDIEFVQVDLSAGEHRRDQFVGRNPLATIPVLELDDGRCLAESRAICTWLEARHPEPNLMGHDGEERAFIEMVDRQVEFQLYGRLANFLRHTHPGLAMLEQPQFPDFGRSESKRFEAAARWLDARLAAHEYVAGARFTVADITAFCTIEFARLARFRAADQGLDHLQEWRDRIAQRPGFA
jgi:glutathione S-transferase